MMPVKMRALGDGELGEDGSSTHFGDNVRQALETNPSPLGSAVFLKKKTRIIGNNQGQLPT